MKLKYKINTIIKYNKLKEPPYTNGIEAIILGNKCICICNLAKLFIFNKIFKLIQTIDLNCKYIFPKNLIPILNYPNLFALQDIIQNEENCVNIYEVQLKKKKVILKSSIKNPKKYINQLPLIFSLSCADILYFFQDNFFIYNIKEKSFTYKKFVIPSEKKYELLKHKKYIIKIIEYNKNELIILLRDIIYEKEDDNYNCEFNIIYLIVLYDIENNDLKKIYMNIEDSNGNYNSYLGSYQFYDSDNGYSSFSYSQNIFLIKNSIVYIKDNQKEFEDKTFYSIYIINILNGDIKYKFEGYDIQCRVGYFTEIFNNFQKSVYLCDNIFLFNGYELIVKKKGVEQNKIIIIFRTNINDCYNSKYYFMKMEKNLFLMYNSHEIKICSFTKE